jgi:exopolyphosphatase/guanosine-5'-triphosphate,3'-diphosphate pyrophosphatase
MSIQASMDIGTNATRLLIAQIKDGTIHPIVMEERITRLGQGMEETGCLTDMAMRRVCDAVAEYVSICHKHHVTEYRTFATSAVRESKNQKEFINYIHNNTGMQPEILSGEEEALLSFLGVQSDYPVSGPIIICDIGGGSTEFIQAENRQLLQSKSINIGSRRFTARFIKSDPPLGDEIINMEKALSQQLQDGLQGMNTCIEDCVCVGGTAVTLAMVAEQIDISNPQSVHHHTLLKTDLLALIDRLKHMTVIERKSIVGLHPDRADVILTGALIMKGIYDFFKMEKATVGIRDLLFGIFLRE